jgi:hypothetical protein
MLPRVVAWLGRPVFRIHPQRTAIAPRRHLSTLNPVCLTSADYVDLSGRARSYGTSFWTAGGVHLRFPSQTRGFFYYVHGPPHAPVAGEVRFRVTPKAEPASFEHGHDLLLPHLPVPWRIPLATIVHKKGTIYALMLKRIREYGFDSDGLVSHVPVYRTTPILHSLGQPFHHEIAKQTIQLRVATGNVLSARVNVVLPPEYSETYVGGASDLQCFGGGANTYIARLGHIMCCFEPFIRNGRQALALRVLETGQLQQKAWESGDLEVPTPVAGELLKTASGDVWTYVLRDGIRSTAALRPLLSNVPAHGYISRSMRQRACEGTQIRTIENLAPASLSRTDWMDFSLLKYIKIYHMGQLAVDYREKTEFPQGTSGFSYVHVPDPAHPIGAQVRFRLVSEPDPAAFAAGHDLHTPNGEVWYRWLPTLVRHRSGEAIASLVKRQGIIDNTIVDDWRSTSDALPSMKASSPLVCPGAPPFSLDLNIYRKRITIGVGARARVVSIDSPFARVFRSKSNIAPFTGRLPVLTTVYNTCL